MVAPQYPLLPTSQNGASLTRPLSSTVPALCQGPHAPLGAPQRKLCRKQVGDPACHPLAIFEGGAHQRRCPTKSTLPLAEGFAHCFNMCPASREGLWIWFEEIACANPKGVVFLIHGLAEDSSRHLHVARHLCRAGFYVVLWDLQGCGRSGDALLIDPPKRTAWLTFCGRRGREGSLRVIRQLYLRLLPRGQGGSRSPQAPQPRPFY